MVFLSSSPCLLSHSGGWPETAHSAEFALTRDGKPQVTIVIAAAPTPAATFGAQELQLHVQKITGAILPISNDTEQVTGPRILVGPSVATSRLGLEESQFADQEYLIRFLARGLVLLGKAGLRTGGTFTKATVHRMGCVGIK